MIGNESEFHQTKHEANLKYFTWFQSFGNEINHVLFLYRPGISKPTYLARF